MLFAGLNLAAGEKMQNLKIILKGSNGEATAILDDTAVARSFAAQLPLTLNLADGYQPYYEGSVRLGVIEGDVSSVAKDGQIKIELVK